MHHKHIYFEICSRLQFVLLNCFKRLKLQCNRSSRFFCILWNRLLRRKKCRMSSWFIWIWIWGCIFGLWRCLAYVTREKSVVFPEDWVVAFWFKNYKVRKKKQKKNTPFLLKICKNKWHFWKEKTKNKNYTSGYVLILKNRPQHIGNFI